ncbi:hypothetical protein [Streptomyces sp. WMMB 322]|uniref:hypothetical protein n=1 Tax=Streptomyces sp. WMMB 322 TaxID=1286821 RepID=UPI0008238B21|nr:hypothetical protein [Streptomyces sp. WMMB 322]SCK47222.1 hypothetical protein H180DRAFT_04212 [Streptomyces sp. WMMB 322]
MKLSPNHNPTEPSDLLIRMHNQVGAAVDVTGGTVGEASRWNCHGCGDRSSFTDHLGTIRLRAGQHAEFCRAAYQRIR